MSASLAIATADRGTLSEALVGGFNPDLFQRATLSEVAGFSLPPRVALVGYWTAQPSVYFPEFMIVNQDDLADTHAWLSSFLNPFTPVTQWCRIWTREEFESLQSPLGDKSLPSGVSVWTGAILAECSLRSGRNVGLQDLSGTVALASASFAAARAAAVWGNFGRFTQVADRYDDLSSKLHDSAVQISAKNLIPLWYALTVNVWSEKRPTESKPLECFRRIFSMHANRGDSDDVSSAVQFVRDEFDLPVILDCATGPQPSRVDALDRLASQLASGPKSAVSDAILGFGASLVDPGAAVLPDLLRRYIGSFPTAPIWTGAFAGLWMPRRVLSDFGGLGRIVSKELLRPSDLFSAPSADISYGELSRWLGPSSNTRFPVRGLVARSISVELVPGTFAAFPVSRFENSRADPQTASRQRRLDLEENRQADRPAATTITAVSRRVEEIYARLIELEGIVSSGGKKSTSKAPRKRI